MTNREAHEEAAGMGLDDMFFRFNKIDPDAEVVDQMLEDAKAFNVPGWTLENHGIVWTIPELMARFATKQIERQTPAIIKRFVEKMEAKYLGSAWHAMSDCGAAISQMRFVAEKDFGMQTVKARREGGERK